MKSKILTGLCLALSLTLVACGGNGGGDDKSSKNSGKSETSSRHEHTFDESKWESNETQHWHPATCEHTTQKGSPKAHEFEKVEAESKDATCKEDGVLVQVCKVCNYKKATTLPKGEHNWGEGVATAAGNGSIAYTTCTCPTCGIKEIEFSALDFDKTDSTMTESCTAEYAKFDTPQYCDKANKGFSADVVGTHLIYKINVATATQKAGLKFYAKTNSNQSSVFDTNYGSDNTPGYEKDENGEAKQVDKRYGLKVNGISVTLGSDSYGASAGVEQWFDWPVEFALTQGINTIDIYSLGGYRASMYKFRLTNVA